MAYAFEKAKEYTKKYTLDANDEFITKQSEDGMLAYVSAGQLATTGSNVFTGGQIIDGNITITGDIYAANFVTSSTLLFTGSTNHGSLIGDVHTYTGSVRISGSLSVIGGINGQINATNGVVSSSAQITAFGFVSGSSQLTSSLDLRYAVTGSNVFTAGQTITGSVTITGSIVMGGTAQTYFSHTITNPSNYVLHQFLTSSYHGATYAFSAHDDSTRKVTVYSNYIIAQGANAINSNIGGDSKVESGAGAPNPTFAVGFSGGYAQFKVTDTGTFTYRGIVQIY